MTVSKRARAIASALLGLLACFGQAPAVRAEADPIDAAAVEILRDMTSFVGGLERFSLEAETMLEEVLDGREQKIQYDFVARAIVERPNRMRVERSGDQLDQLLIYDGASLWIHDRAQGYYAFTAAPDDLDDLLHFARESLDLVPPASDIVYTDAFDLLTGGLESAFVVGKSVVGGVRCDHLAFRNASVDWQIWISEGDEPLPYKYVLTTRNDPERPQLLMLMRNWNVSPRVRKGTFTFSKPSGAEQIEFLRLDSDPLENR